MENNFLKPCSQNKGAKALFYIFEISALCVGVLLFILAIIWAAQGAGFGAFLQMFVQAVFYTLVLFGFGKIIDLLSCKAEHHHGSHGHHEKDEEKEDKE